MSVLRAVHASCDDAISFPGGAITYQAGDTGIMEWGSETRWRKMFSKSMSVCPFHLGIIIAQTNWAIYAKMVPHNGISYCKKYLVEPCCL